MVSTQKNKLRKQLLQQRHALTPAQRTAAEAAICTHLAAWLYDKNYTSIGAYWPIRGEADLRPLLTELAQRYIIALPVSQQDQPLRFVRWQPGQAMMVDAYQIPIPAESVEIHPECLLIPCVGFDRAGYRLGYGAGFYDRTLAAWHAQGKPRPALVGIGFSCGRITSGFHEAHDVALGTLVSEDGVLPIKPA